MSKLLTNNGLSRVIVNIKDLINNKADKKHSSYDISYGMGTPDAFGHVKVTDYFRSEVGTAWDGLCASQSALFNAFNDLNNRKLNLSGGTMSGTITFPVWHGIHGLLNNSDCWRIIGLQTGDDNGELEIATSDNGTEPIVVRQYTGDGANYGSFGNPVRTAVLLDGNGNTSFPGSVTGHVFVAQSSTISTSDRNLKDNIISLLDNDIWIKFFMKLNPVSYIFKDGSSGRTHVGFISQDVEDIMNELGMSSLDFAGFCKDIKMETITEEITIVDKNGEETILPVTKQVPVLDENGNHQYIYSLRYEEFIAINTHIIQLQQKEIENINDRLSIIESKLVNL